MITFPNGFKITSKEPVDNRLVLSKEEMRNAVKATLPDVYFTICTDDNQLYVYNVNNQIDDTTGKFRLANAEILKAIAELGSQLADNNSIIYLDDLNKLSIKGYNDASQGQMLVKDRERGLVWVNPIDTTALNNAVASAEQAAGEAGRASIQAGNAAISAEESATAAYDTAMAIRNMYWFGTMEEYNALEQIDPNRIYTITNL